MESDKETTEMNFLRQHTKSGSKSITVNLFFTVLIFLSLTSAYSNSGNIANISQAKAEPSAPVQLKVIRPKIIKDFEISVEQPADVSPYYRVELYSEVAGQVIFLEKDLGDNVIAGEKLVAIRQSSSSSGAERVEEIWELKAPFDGVIASRSIDPGTFVPSAAIVPGAKPLLVLERNDIVTVSMKVPDIFSGFVTFDSMAEVQLDSLPGKVFVTKLARIAPSLNSADRSLTVQVDIYNRSLTEYEQFSRKFKENQGADLKSRRLPPFPGGVQINQAADLIPGMYGKIRLRFQNLAERPLIPSISIIRRGGMDYLFSLDSGIVRLRPITIHYNNGELALVSWLVRSESAKSISPLTTSDKIILTQLSDLEDGQPAISIESDW
ncbi:MAG: hypothetical protein RJA81_2373 [Planctomycetota bacterium]